MPAVSIVIPVYNTEKYLRRCLDSVCNQTLKDIEIICVNDGSTDGSAAILADYAAKDSRVKVITQKNAGAGAARNVGIEAATGEYLGFVDSDDFVDSDFYQRVIERQQDVVLGDLVEERHDAQGKVVELINSPFYKRMRCDALEHKVGFRGIFPVAIYRKELISRNNIRFVEKRTVGEDRIFPMLASYHTRSLGVVDGTFYHYCYRDGSATRRTMQKQDVEGVLGYIRDIIDFLRHHRLSSPDKRFLVNRTFSEIFYKPILTPPFVNEVIGLAETFYREFRSACDYRDETVRAVVESVRCGLGIDNLMGRLELDVVRANAFRKIHKVV